MQYQGTRNEFGGGAGNHYVSPEFQRAGVDVDADAVAGFDGGEEGWAGSVFPLTGLEGNGYAVTLFL